jgi:1-aminocyclopropane-1-carboxylate deaminase/D-cysteine desulfhydrase-like pyridoxal-dependent ACC family enzyme
MGLFLVGGNKIRELEFLVPDVKQKGADVIIMSGTSQSNYGAQLAAVAGKLGMEVILLLDKDASPVPQGPLLLSSLYGAKVEIFEAGFDQEPTLELSLKNKRVEELVAEVRSTGQNPYVLDLNMPLTKVGYVDEIREICVQLQEQGTTAQYLIVANCAGCTMGGLLVGAKHLETPFEVIGVSVHDKPEVAHGQTADRANGIARLLETDMTFNPEELTIFYDYIGEGYGIPTKECVEAIKLVARTEGILLDPVYTGKVMAGLIDLIGKGKFTSKDTIIFLHTGGVAKLFVYNKELSSFLL